MAAFQFHQGNGSTPRAWGVGGASCGAGEEPVDCVFMRDIYDFVCLSR